MSDTAFETVIGLEIHVQLNTRTKMFCSCPTEPDQGKPNTSICPVCTGQPGVLPVLNAKAVEMATKAALALGCRINKRSIMARKNYFYPDLPKGYQISQYEQPLAEHGFVTIEDGGETKKIGITRLHIEDDAGKSLHAIGSQELDCTLIDFNRCGMPLAEIVSEPDMRSPEQAYKFLTTLKTLMQWVGASSCDMEKGELRVDVNLSVRPKGQKALGTKVELKNLNSFKAVKDALAYESARQIKEVSSGGKIIQETRLWDDNSGSTAPMRSKEEAHDYRYFPDPDLVPLAPADAWVEELRKSLPELPDARKARFASAYSLGDYDAEVLTSSAQLADYFEAVVSGGKASAKTASNWIQTELLGRLNAAKLEIGASPISAKNLSGLVAAVDSGKISGKMGKDVFEQMWTSGKSAEELIEKSGLSQVSDAGQLKTWAEQAVAANPKAAQDYRSGNEKAIGSLVGGVMKLSKGKANPGLVNEILKEVLKA